MHRLLCTVLGILLASSIALAQSFTESFNTTTYRDAVTTTAIWDTAEGTIHLAPVGITWIGGRSAAGANRVLFQGGIVYLARGLSGVEFIDVTNPLSPSLAGSLPYGGSPPQVVLDIGVTDDILYVSWSKTISVFPLIVQYGVDVYSVASPSTPTFVQTLSLIHAEGLTVHGNRLYMATGSALLIYDITDPAFPASLGSIALTGTPRAVAVGGTTAYVASGTSGMHVVDVSNPAAPVLAATQAFIGAEAVDVDGTMAAVAAGNSGVGFFDVTVPGSPNPLGQWTGATASAVRLDGDVATVADGTGGVVFLDVADPTNPVLVQSSTDGATIFDVTAGGSLVFVANNLGLGIYDGVQTPPAALQRSVTTGSTANPTGLRVAGNYAYMTDGVLRIYDATRTGALASVGTWGASGVRAVDVDGEFAYVDASGTFTVLDVTNPAAPSVVGTSVSGTFGLANDVVAHGSLVFVSYQNDGLYVFDVSNPAAPALLDTYPSSAAWDLDVSGGNVYMTDANVGLRIISASNPAVLALQGTFSSAGVTSVALSGHYAFLGGGSGSHQGLEVIDVSNPASPVKVGGVNFVPERFYVSGNVLMTVGPQSTLFMDITNPANPVTVSSYSPGGTHINYDGAIYGDMAYVAEWFSPSQGRLLELRAFDRGVVSANNVAASTTIGTTPYALGAMRMTPTEQGSISWFYSPNDGGNFYPIVADGTWQDAASSATSTLRWKATLNNDAAQPEPVCSHLVVEWRGVQAAITSIADVPADQGGQVQVNFLASGRELTGVTPVVAYSVFRQAGASWDSVGVVAPTGADAYSTVAPTDADSTLWDGPVYSVFKIRTWFSIGYVDSPLDSAYSVDNIAPGPPTSVTANYNTGSGNHVHWTAAPDADVIFYRLHRGNSPGFPISSATLIDSTDATDWYDPSYDGWSVYYAATTVDSAGNESTVAYPGVTTGVGGGETVRYEWALEQNVPNPFNPVTRIPFTVPSGGGRATLTVFDVSGRRVVTLFDRNAEEGAHFVTWGGRDASGRRVSSGVYFFRLTTPAGEFTRKMTLLQ